MERRHVRLRDNRCIELRPDVQRSSRTLRLWQG
jgi:hypothetical protein